MGRPSAVAWVCAVLRESKKWALKTPNSICHLIGRSLRLAIAQSSATSDRHGPAHLYIVRPTGFGNLLEGSLNRVFSCIVSFWFFFGFLLFFYFSFFVSVSFSFFHFFHFLHFLFLFLFQNMFAVLQNVYDFLFYFFSFLFF